MVQTGSIIRPGGVAALVCAGTYLFGMVLLFGVLSDVGMGSPDTDLSAMVAFVAERTGLMSLWYLTIYVLNGLALVLLVLALETLVAPHAPNLARMIRAFGLIWATLVIGAGMAANVGVAEVARLYEADPEAALLRWTIAEAIEVGIGGGNEILGGILALLTGWAGLRTPALPTLLGALGLAIGIAGLLTLLPVVEPIAAPIFGLGYIVWFIWTGITLLLKPNHV